MIRAVRALCAVLALGVIAVLVAACSSSGSSKSPGSTSASQLNDKAGSGTYQGLGLDPAQPRPNFTLTDTAGRTYAFGAKTAGRPTLLYFGYTNCPDVCPTTMADVHSAISHLSPALQKKIVVVFVSTDVKRDTAAVITRWLSNFSEGTSATFVGLRGTQAQVAAAETAAHVSVSEDDGATHSAQVLLYGTDDYARVTYVQSTTEAQAMQHDLPIVARAAA